MIDTKATDHLLCTTRAVRRRLDLDRPVGREVILDCLRLAVQAPTAGNARSWHWMVITDPDKRAALGQLYAKVGREHLEQGLASAGSDEQTQRVYESALHLADIMTRVPVMVIPCIEGRADRAGNAVAAVLYGSIIPAAWSFQLALRSRGLGSAWTTLHLLREQEVAATLGIPDGVTQVALLPVAYTLGLDFKPAVRPPVEQITHWDSWDTVLAPTAMAPK